MELSETEKQLWHNQFRKYRKRDLAPERIQEINERNMQIIELSAHGFGVPEIRKILGGGQTWDIGQVRMDARKKHLW